MAMMEKIERIKQHASVEELQAMLLQTEKSSESRSQSPPKHSDKGDVAAPGGSGSGVSASQGNAATPQVKKGKGSLGSGSKAKQLPARSASVPLESASASAAAAAAAAAAAGNEGDDGGSKGDEGIAFIVDGRFDQRPSTSASKSRCAYQTEIQFIFDAALTALALQGRHSRAQAAAAAAVAVPSRRRRVW